MKLGYELIPECTVQYKTVPRYFFCYRYYFVGNVDNKIQAGFNTIIHISHMHLQ